MSIPGARSLKDRRSVVRSFKERTQDKYRVSVAEIGPLEVPKYAMLGVAVISNESSYCDRVLADVAASASTLANAILTDRATEIISFGEGGRGVQGGIEQLLDDGGPYDAEPTDGESTDDR